MLVKYMLQGCKMKFISTLLNYGAYRRFIFFKYTLSNYLAEVFSRIQLSVFYPSTVNITLAYKNTIKILSSSLNGSNKFSNVYSHIQGGLYACYANDL